MSRAGSKVGLNSKNGTDIAWQQWRLDDTNKLVNCTNPDICLQVSGKTCQLLTVISASWHTKNLG